MVRWIGLVCLAATMLWPRELEADIIYLKNGDRIAGKVLESDEQAIKVDVGGVTLSIPMSEVIKVERERPTPTPTPVPTLRQALPPPTVAEKSLEGPFAPPPKPSGEVTAASFPELPLLPVVLPRGRTYRVTGSAVRFRDGPGLDYDVVDTLLRGTLLSALEEIDEWIRARTFDGLEGWMHGKYLQPLANIPVVVAADRLHLRDGPSTAYRSLGRFRRGDVLILLNEQGDWWRVQSPSMKVGWCSARYLLKVNSASVIRPRLSRADLGGVTISRRADKSGLRETITLGTTNDDFVVRGLTHVLAFHRDKQPPAQPDSTWSGRDLLRIQVLQDQVDLAHVGFEKDITRKYIGASILLVRGRKTGDTWTYTFDGPGDGSVEYAMVVQKGARRGSVVYARR